MNNHKLINHDFSQPEGTPYSRVMQDREEIIDYLDNSHVRIWHNTEADSFDNHYHNCIEIIYMQENDCLVKLPTKDIPITSGDIIIIPPYMMHQVEGSKQVQQFVLLLDVELLIYFGMYASSTSSINDILLCNKDNCPHIYNAVRNNIIDMINSYFANEDYWQLEVYSHFLQLISILGKNGSLSESVNVVKKTSGTKEHYDKFAELLQYIELNFSEPITLDSISSHVGFSKYHFIRLFKEYTGTTFYDYLTSKRIQHAKDLLGGTLGITDIAFSCGFNNQTSFCRSFKKEVGMTPTEYRQTVYSK